ncbi:pyridoxamine 5'-phosphate oxidase family protein [Micromonospora olivasterospora]|uniref:General stress protein 26 n=1 Tax=Micromonospora olivasterospora TaxID=1880 RepID=A0A562I4T8_MICOL|nr:pyridoxamine 5'-phosphate oxidase family protein [Micromonospora olivasterospora]TWH65725.1 general stress protein 26 [Micromonospora olivasterospora]
MSSDRPRSDDVRRRVTELVRAARTCVLTTFGLDGRLVGRPMLLQQAEFDGDLWFFAYADSTKVRQIRVNPEVNAAFPDHGNQAWVSLSGTAQEAYDPERARRLWSPPLWIWFPDGPATSGLTLLRVRVSSAVHWDAPGGSRLDLLDPARGKVPERPPRPARNREVRF